MGVKCMIFRSDWVPHKSRDSCVVVCNPTFYIYRLHLENRRSNNLLKIGLRIKTDMRLLM